MRKRNFVSVAAVCVVILATVTVSRAVRAQADDPENPCMGYPYPPGVVPCNLVPAIKKVELQVDETEQEALKRWQSLPINSGTKVQQIRILGKLLLYDKNLSVNRNTACTFCHSKETGFTGPISEINQTIVTYPGSVRYRFAQRKPMSYMYAPYSPVFHFDQTQQAFYGGNFWDQSATGWKLQNPSAEQAQNPPVDPLEQGFADSACVVHRISQAAYKPLFVTVWMTDPSSISWPSNIDEICNQPTQGPTDPEDPGPVPLSNTDRMLSNVVYDRMGLSIAAHEAGPEESPFTTKFDYAIAHPNQQVLSAEEQEGWELFDGKGKCNLCHVDSTTAVQKGTANITPDQVPEAEPLFADFQAFNLGLPKNTRLPYYYETKPDKWGVTPNPMGFNYTDNGLGDFLRGPTNPNSNWAKYADASDGKFITATTRDVDKRPSPDFVKAYFHNGVIKDLKTVVHFYNTRDVLPKCAKGVDDPGFGVTCWPPPEVPKNVDQRIGNLGLTSDEEQDIVDFMKTLTDGYRP